MSSCCSLCHNFLPFTGPTNIPFCILYIAGCSRPPRSVAVRRYPSPKVRGRDGERQAATAQGRRPRGASPRPRSGVAAERSNPITTERLLPGAGGRRGATPRSRSGGAAVRRYPSSKVRSSSCALLEQP